MGKHMCLVCVVLCTAAACLAMGQNHRVLLTSLCSFDVADQSVPLRTAGIAGVTVPEPQCCFCSAAAALPLQMHGIVMGDASRHTGGSTKASTLLL
jgi:hypothetical protein